MRIDLKKDGDTLTVVVEGHIDTTTAPELDAKLKSELEGIIHFYLDLAAVEYISSAGLRVILSASKIMANQGTMNIVNTPAEIKDIFDMTGFSEVLNIE